MSKRFLAILICVVLVTQIFSVNMTYAAGETDSPTADTIDLKEKGLDPLNQFTALSMKLALLSTGDAKIKYNVNLSNDNLNNYRNLIMEMIHNNTLPCDDFPKQEDYDTTELYDQAVKDFNDTFYCGLSDSILPTIKTTITYDKDYFDIPAGKEHTPLYSESSDQPIGTCDFTHDSNGNIVLTLQFSKIVYNRSDVDLAFSLDYIIKKSLGSNETLIPIWDDSKSIVTGKIVEKEPGLVEVEPVYTLKKTAPVVVDTPYIDYTITTNVQDGYLNGKTVVDAIPDGLFVESVILNGNPLSASSYTVVDGQFNYTFPSLLKDKSNALTDSTLKLRLYLAKDSYKNFMKDNQINKKFTNTAYLKSPVTNEQLTAPSSAMTQIKLNFLQKEGEQEDLYGTRFKWTVKVNSYFTHEVNAYIVDTIDASTHTYDTATGVDILENNVLSQTVHPKLITSSVPYETLTLDDLNSMTAVSEGSTEKQSIYYTYTDSDSKKRSVMVIPYDKYINNAVSLNYSTNIVLPDGVKKEDYKNTSGEILTNRVKMLWDVINISGSSIPFDFNIDVEKNIQTTTFIVDKTFGTYNSASHEITWDLFVNKLGGTFDNVYITDTVNTKVLTFQDNILDGTGTIAASYIKDSNTETVNIPSETNKVSGKPYYVIDTPSENERALKIVFGHLEPNESYKVPINTRITYKDFYLNSPPITFSNKAVSYGEVNGHSCGNESMDSKSLSNSLVNKIGIMQPFTNLAGKQQYISYDHKNHTTLWRTTINEDRVTLENLSAEEILPTGSTFNRMKAINIYNQDNSVLYKITSTDGVNFLINGAPVAAVEKDGGLSLTLPDGQVITWKETAGTKTEGKDITVPSNTVNITFKDPVDYKIDYDFYVTYSEIYRREILANRSTLTINEVKLHAQYKGENLQTVRKSNALTIKPLVIDKKGVYHKNLGTITWTIYINQDAVNLQDYSSIESLRNEFDFEADTLSISTFDVTPCGEINSLNDVTDDLIGNVITNGSHGFAFTIPETYKSTPLCIQFDTALADNIAKEDASNQASLNNGKVQYRKTDKVIPSNMEDFNLYEFINASKLSSVFITKVSSTKDNLGNNSILLSETEFTLTAMKLSGSTLVEDAKRYSKMRTTKANGNAVFFNLESGIIYKLVEKNPTNGYNNTDSVKYLVFLKDGDKSSSYPSNVTTINASTKILKTTIENTPNGKLSFKKVGDKEKALSGVQFKLTRTDKNVVDRFATSDSTGMVNFNALDSGSYVLSEIKTPTNYKPIDDLDVTINLNEDGTYSTSIETSANVTIDGSNNITIQNELIIKPSITPSVSPSTEPTLTPSLEPVVSPSAEPTLTPSLEPVVSPSVEPTLTPGLEPMASSLPSSTTSPEIVTSPNVSSTPGVTVSPSLKPSKKPGTGAGAVISPSIKPNISPTKRPASDITDTDTNNNANTNTNYNNCDEDSPITNTLKPNHSNSAVSTTGDNYNSSSNSNNNITTHSNTIPKTGDNSIPIIIYILIGSLSLIGVLYSSKKLLHK